MKILFTLTRSFNPNDAGVQRTTYKLGKYFTEQGYTVAYFSTKVTGHVPVEFGILYSVTIANGLNVKTNQHYLEKVLQEFQPHIVINQMPYEENLRNLLGIYKKKYNYMLVGCLRNSLFNFISNIQLNISWSVPRWLFKCVNNKVGITCIRLYHIIKHRAALKSILDVHDYFVLLAPQNIDELKFFVGDYKNHKIRVIPNSIPAIYESHLATKEKVILYVGSLNIQQKRADLLLSFWQKVYPVLTDWEFLIVGHGAYTSTIENQIREKKLPRVRLEGFQKPESYYARASVFMMPSAYEGFPNTILEAQSHGCPVLAFKSYAALDWIVNQGEDAMLSQPFDIREMANNAIDLIGNSTKLVAMQLAALENANRFTIDKVGRQWTTFFNSIIA